LGRWDERVPVVVSGRSRTPILTASAYPSHQAPAKDYPLGRQLLVIKAIHARLIDPTVARELLNALPHFAVAVAEDVDLSVADMLQAEVAVGFRCAAHLVELSGNDIDGTFCLLCEFDEPERRYRNHAEIPFPMGEVIERVHDESEYHELPGWQA
jgi:hypothetical protein